MTDVGEISIPITADTKDIESALARVAAQGDKIKPVNIPVDADTSKAQAALLAAEGKAISFAQAQASVAAASGNFAQAQRTLQGSLDGITASTTRSLAAQRQLIAVQNQQAAAAAKAQRDIVTLAQAQARLAVASNDSARAEQILTQAISQVGAGSRAALSAQTQLAAIQNKAASSAQTLGGALSGLNSALGAVGFGVGVGTVLQFGQAAITSANQLEKTQATLRAIAGSQGVYNQALQIAEQNQRMFGGSLNDNLAPLQQFLFIANRSGASLDELNQAAQLLSTINPAEGFEGAGVALSEFFSGDITSLAERFNLPRAALRDLTAEGVTAQEKLAGLASLLAAQGVTAETLNASLNTTAATYDRLGSSLSNLQTTAGGALSQVFEPTARGANLAAQGATELINVLSGAPGQISAAQQAIAASAGSYEEYVAQARAAQEAAQAQADATLSQFGPLAAIGGLIATVAIGNQTLSEAEFNAAQAAATQADATQQQASAAVSAADAAQAAATASNAKAVADLEQSAAAQQTAQAHDALKAAIENAANSSLSAEDAARRIASVFAGVEAPQVAALINLYRELNATRAGSKGGGALAKFNTTYGGAAPGDVARAEKASAESSAARRDQLLAVGSAAQVAALRQQEYNNAVKLYGASSAEAVRAETALMQAQERAAKTTGGGGGGGGKVSVAQKAAQQVAKTESDYRKAAEKADKDYQERVLDAEAAYQERRLQIISDYAEKRRQSEQSFADAQFQDREDFYTSLINVDASKRTQMIQEYEAAQQKAAEIASTQGADAAEKYLALVTDIIRKRADRAAAIQKALEDGNKKEAEFLQGVDAIARANEERKLAQAAQGTDTLGAQEQAALADAATQRNEALAAADEKRQEALASAGEKAAARVGTAQETLAQKTGATNTALQAQLDLLDKIGQQTTGSAPAPAATTPTPAPTTPTPAPAIPAPSTGGPVPVSDAGAAAGLASVADQLRTLARSVDKLGQRSALGSG